MKFKVIAIFISFCCCAFSQQKSGYNGQPGCQTLEEMTVKFYRNFWDPTAYWECVVRGQPGVPRRCYDGNAFMTNKRGCVPWMDWVWEPEVVPPSRPTLNYEAVEIPNESKVPHKPEVNLEAQQHI